MRNRGSTPEEGSGGIAVFGKSGQDQVATREFVNQSATLSVKIFR